ncbi:MAG: hypothetical protein KDE19_19610 [Caldilineaceae bacterium]|nr:hypothetical protein [Caldilineaceae bacterium]
MKSNSRNSQQSLRQRLLTNYVVSFLLWLISTALLILDVLYGRLLLMGLFQLGEINYWVLSFIDRTGVLILGLIALCFSLFFEYYYRKGVDNQQLWPRFLRATLFQLVIILAGLGVTWFVAPQ